MFCSNCGIEASGNFCFNCGSPLAQKNVEEVIEEIDIIQDEEIETEDKYIVANGVEVNISEIIRICGKSRIEAIKVLREQTGISLTEGKKIIDAEYEELQGLEPKKSFGERFKEQMQIEAEKQRIIKQEKAEMRKQETEKIRQMDKEGIAYCPKCKSTSLSANKKGFGVGKALAGGLIAPVGLAAGFIGKNKITVTCLNCGNTFKPGK